MANFQLEFLGGDVVPWIDPPSLSPVAPSRLNADPQHPHNFRRVIVAGAGPLVVQVKARVAGVLGPADAALGGKLFSSVWAESSGLPPPAIVTAPGVSSVLALHLFAYHAGHHLLRVARPAGGAVLLPFDVETA